MTLIIIVSYSSLSHASSSWLLSLSLSLSPPSNTPTVPHSYLLSFSPPSLIIFCSWLFVHQYLSSRLSSRVINFSIMLSLSYDVHSLSLSHRYLTPLNLPLPPSFHPKILLSPCPSLIHSCNLPFLSHLLSPSPFHSLTTQERTGGCINSDKSSTTNQPSESLLLWG